MMEMTKNQSKRSYASTLRKIKYSLAALSLLSVSFIIFLTFTKEYRIISSQSEIKILTPKDSAADRKNFEGYVQGPNTAPTYGGTEPSDGGPAALPDTARLWPGPHNSDDDRILLQNEFIPNHYRNKLRSGQKPTAKKILLYAPFNDFKTVNAGLSFFAQCPVNSCAITYNKSEIAEADMVVFHDELGSLPPHYARPPNQIWLLNLFESPYLSPSLKAARGLFNWTATYRRDSTIVSPYAKFVHFNRSVLGKPQEENFAANKWKKVAWFASHCDTPNGRRSYVRELSRHIGVDIYGRCGSLRCPRAEAASCFRKLKKDYKFYLAFENSNCRDYITEKLFINALQHDVLPIVMGAAPEDYELVAPHHSYIHVDEFDSPRALADHLYELDTDDQMYNSYFRWKGTGKFVSLYLEEFRCRMCAMLHVTPLKITWYDDLDTWWRGDGVCIGKKSWRNVKRKKPIYKIKRNNST